MATMLETPSRIWRRIGAAEDADMPSLPSVTGIEDSGDILESSVAPVDPVYDDDSLSDDLDISSPYHSTPASTQHTVTSLYNRPSSTSSTARFAQSIASRSNKSITGSFAGRKSQHQSFEVPSLPAIAIANSRFSDNPDEERHEDSNSVPEVYLPPPDEEEDQDRDFSLTDALESISRSSSPSFPPAPASRQQTPKKGYEDSFKSEVQPLQPSPFSKYRNVAMRRTNPRARTPSLTRTSSDSQTSSPTNSTPRSGRSVALPAHDLSPGAIPLPPSTTASPALREADVSNVSESRSMDITDVHISPPRLDADAGTEPESTPYDQTREGPQEPTFSSEEEDAPTAMVSGATSPSQSVSIAATPTPAFPRPRARFELPAPPSEILATPAPRDFNDDTAEQDHNDLVTPATRRRSFLLSVIHSTARPRMRFPTPHARRVEMETPGMTTEIEETPRPSNNVQGAFAGVTPHPRMAPGRRSSHPLSQMVSAASPSNDSGSEISSAPGDKPSTTPSPSGLPATTVWATPAHNSSPYNAYSNNNASFISTASSHDLTTHQRANTSFDPAMGFASNAPGHGVNRFNANKLNTYLHGLNRRLQEENEALANKLRAYEEEKGNLAPTSGEASGNRRLSAGSGAGSRRSSAVGTLGGVQENMAEEERAELERIVDELETEKAVVMEEKEEAERALQVEREERDKDNERWKERMGEVEAGVTNIIAGLESRLAEAEEREHKAREAREAEAGRAKDLEKKLVQAQGERDVAVDRAAQAERVLEEDGEDLNGALKEANDRVGQVMGDLRNANAQIKDLEDEVAAQDHRIEELEKELHEERDAIAGLEEELGATADSLAAERKAVLKLEERVRQQDEELRSMKEYADELEEGAETAVERLETLNDELAAANDTVKALQTSEQQTTQDMKALQNELLEARETARQMEEALEEAEQKMVSDEGALATLRSKIAGLEREKQREADRSSRELSRTPAVESGPTEEEYAALEDELNKAEQEIARLNTLISQSPARKAMDRAKDTKIEMLEREKEELLERNRALRMTFNEMATPSRVINAPGISPIHRQVLNMSIRPPKTPGGPLRDLSWLKTPGNDPSVTPLISEINRLQRELDQANDSIDDKLDKLEDAGMGVIGLTKKLEDARAKIVALEDEIARLSRREDRRIRRLNRVRCQKCNVKVDLKNIIQADDSSIEFGRDNLPSEPPTPPTRTSEALRAELHHVNQHLEELREQWNLERMQLLGEKAVLENAATRLNSEVKSSKEEVRRAIETNKVKSNIFSELDKAKQTISVLENELSSERSRLRTLVAEQDRLQRDKKQILADLQRTETDMDDVKAQLQKYKRENQEIEKELRENAGIEQKARLLETRVVENAETIEQLRAERTILAADHKELQRRFAEVSENANKIRDKYVTQSTSHDNRRHELDLHRQEIDDLKRALEDRDNDLQRVQKEKQKIATEKSDVARTVAALEADLRRVRRDAENFGKDLKLLRAEKETLEAKGKEDMSKAERARKQAQTEIRLLNEQLEAQKQKYARAAEALKAQSQASSSDETQMERLRVQHKKECKGLMLQIRYLKAKFTRESTFRCDLTYQKKYLLTLMDQFERSERNILGAIARIGFPLAPAPSTPRKRTRKLKSVVNMIIFLGRARKSSDSWRKESEHKQAIAAALEDVRRRRAIGAS